MLSYLRFISELSLFPRKCHQCVVITNFLPMFVLWGGKIIFAGYYTTLRWSCFSGVIRPYSSVHHLSFNSRQLVLQGPPSRRTFLQLFRGNRLCLLTTYPFLVPACRLAAEIHLLLLVWCATNHLRI